MCLNRSASRLTKLCPSLCIVQQIMDRGQQFTGLLELLAGLGFLKDANDIPEVPCVGAEECCGAVGRGFDHVLSAAVAEASTDKGDIRQPPAGAQFTDSVQQSDGCCVLCFRGEWGWC